MLLLALTWSALAASPEDTARDALLARLELPAGVGHAVRVDRSLPWAGGTRVRLRHELAGLPVEGADLVVSLDPRGAVRSVAGSLRVTGALDPNPVVPASDAVAAARQVAAGFGAGSAWEPRVERVAWLDRSGVPHLAWAVDVASAAPFRQWRVLVDAHDGEVLSTRPTSFDARANVFPSNPIESVLTEVDLQGLTSATELTGEYASVRSCDTWDDGGLGGLGGGSCSATSPHALADSNGDYLYAADPMSFDDPMSEVQMYHHLDLVSAWFEAQVGFAHDRPMDGIVNFPMLNAFYGDANGDGRGDVAFGQGGSVDFAYDGDVVYHEFSHSVIGTVTSLGFFGADAYGVTFAPLALNEGSADLFSLILTGDPKLGAYAGSGFGGGGAIRDLERDRTCPDDLYGEAHADGEIWGSLGWNLIEALGPELSMQLVYGTVIGWTDPDLTYGEAGQSLVDTAAELHDAGVLTDDQHALVTTLVDASGLVGCVRVIPLDDGRKPTLFTQYIGIADIVGHIPLTAQFSIEVPEGATELEFDVRDWAATGDMGWTAFVRRGEHVVYDVTGVAGFQIPQVATYDLAVDGEGKGGFTLPDPERGLVLEPGATYYVSLATRNLGGISGFDLAQGEVTVAASVTCCEEVAAKEEPRACGCATGGAVGGWAGLLGLAAFAARRRR